MKKKALIITWTGYSDEELIFSYYALQQAGFQTTIMSDVVSTPENKKPLKGVNGCSFHSDFSTKIMRYEGVGPFSIKDYDLLILIGGVKAIEKLRQEDQVILAIKEWNEQGKVIGSICHGGQLLISAKCVKDRKISGYYSIKDDLENAGAIYVDQSCVIDENIVSTAHYKDQGYWMAKVLEVYEQRNKQ